MESVGKEKIRKNPSNSRHKWKFLKPNSRGKSWWSLMSLNFDIWNGAAYKVVKQDLKNYNDLDICTKEVL